MVLRKKKPTNAQLKDESAVNAVGALHELAARIPHITHSCSFLATQARRQGVAIETVRKGAAKEQY